MKRYRILCLMLSAALCASSLHTAYAEPADEDGRSPVDTAKMNDGDIPSAGYVPIGDGFVPDKVTTDEDFDPASADGLNALGDTLSTSYVPVDQDFIPKVYENQGSSNTCWALSQMTACEINAKKKGLLEADETLSASHLGYFFYNMDEDMTDPNGNTAGDYTRMASPAAKWTDAPGNGRLSMWEAAGWVGAVSYTKNTGSAYDYERIVSANDVSSLFDNNTDTAYLCDDVHVQNVYLSGLDGEKRADAKNLILHLGAVTAGYYASQEYDSFAQAKAYDDGYGSSYGNYYYDGSNNKAANHAVTLIGWDDGYSRDNFVKTPEGDGAWLVLNSWGEEDTTLAQNGLFWLSYYDAGLLSEGIAIGYATESAENYENIYQYDGSCGVASISMERGVQFFDVNSTQQIKAVSIGVKDTNVSCTAAIYQIDGYVYDYYDDVSWIDGVLSGTPYTDDDGQTLVSAKKLGEKQTTLSYPGYHTIDLTDVEMDAIVPGSTVAVVFDFSKPTNVFIDKTETVSAWKFVTGEDEYRGIYSLGANNAVMEENTALRIKMFTDSHTDSDARVEFTTRFDTIDLSYTETRITAKAENVANAGDYHIVFYCPENDYMSVDSATGQVTPKKVGGPVTITAFLYNNESGSCVAANAKEFSIVSALKELVIEETEVSLYLKESRTLAFHAEPSTADTKNVTWESSDRDIVSVDESGTVTATGYGSAEIVCKKEGVVSNVCTVTVAPSFTGVELDKHALSLKKGASYSLNASLLPEGNEDIAAFTFKSSNPEIASVDSEGKIKALDYGTAVITVTCGTYSDSCEVTVTGKMTGVSLNKQRTAVLKGKTTQLVAQALPDDTTDPVSFKWDSSDTSIATVDSDGVVTGVNFGEAQITVFCGGFTDSCSVIVSGQVSAINFDKKSILLKKGAKDTIKVSLEPQEIAENPQINLTSSDGSVATISEDGVITAIGDGKCTISAAYGNLVAECEVIVDSLQAMDGKTAVSSVSLKEGNTKALTAAWNIQETLPSVRWKSSNTNIADVDTDGTVRGISKGTAFITLSTMDGVFTKTIIVTVTDKDTGGEVKDPEEAAAVLSVSNSTALKDLTTGQSVKLSVSYTPSTLQGVKITYTASNPNVADVSSDGVVLAKGAGSAAVTVTLTSAAGKVEKTFPVSVKESSSGSTPGVDVPIAPSSYTILIKNASEIKGLEVGESKRIAFALYDGNGKAVSNTRFTCTADDIYASLDSNSVLTAKKAGTAILNVTAYLDGKELAKKMVYVSIRPASGIVKPYNTPNGEIKEEIKPDPVPSFTKPEDKTDNDAAAAVLVSQIKLSAPERRISTAGRIKIKAAITPSTAQNQKVKWHSSNTRYATVNRNGVVKAKKAGAGKSVIITCKATDGSGTVASYYVTITKDSVKKITISAPTTKKKQASVKAGKSISLNYKVTTTGKDVSKKLIWSVSNKKWATVTVKGKKVKVKTKKAGKGHTVTVTAKNADGSKKARFKIRIK